MRRVCAGVLWTIAATASTAFAQRSVDERRAVSPEASIRVQNLVGSTRIIGWDRDTLAVRGTAAERFYLAVGEGGVGVKVGVELPLNETEARPSHLEIRVPARARVWVKSASAEIEVAGVEGSLDLNTVNGAIRVRGHPKEVYAESMDGPVEVSGSTPFTRVKTASGSITLRGVQGEAIAATVSGTLRAEDVRLERGRFESVVGDIRFDADLGRSGSFHFESHSGTIELRLPATTAAEFEITSFDGEIENRLSFARPQRGRDLRSQELNFSLGLGGAHVTIRNFKGRVLLARKP